MFVVKIGCLSIIHPNNSGFSLIILRVTTDVIHKTGECYIGFSTNKPYCTPQVHAWFVPQTEYMLDKATCLGFFPNV